MFRNGLEDVLKEVQVLRQVDHPNVVRLEEVIEQEEKLFLVLEYAHFGQVMQWQEQEMRYSLPSPDWFSEETLRLVFRDCLRGMAYRILFYRGSAQPADHAPGHQALEHPGGPEGRHQTVRPGLLQTTGPPGRTADP